MKRFLHGSPVCRLPVLLGSLALLLSTAHGRGIPEPNLIFYGKVTNTAGTVSHALYAGSLNWTLVPASGPAFNIPVVLENLDNGNYSYRVEIPSEKVPAGFTLSADTLEAAGSEKTFTLAVTFNGEPATMVLPDGSPHTGTAGHQELGRGKIERIDLEVSAETLDSDGDGIPDWWEALYPTAMNPYNIQDALLDADGDGVPNILEYLEGSDPTCFEWTKWLTRHSLNTTVLGDPNADPDQDGIVNLMEYALGTDPRTPDAELANARSHVSTESYENRQYLTLTVQRPANHHCNVDYLVETSNNLLDWSSTEGRDIVALLKEPAEIKIRDATHLGQMEPGKRFIRLKLIYKP
jgi:hypothetical protein